MDPGPTRGQSPSPVPVHPRGGGQQVNGPLDERPIRRLATVTATIGTGRGPLIVGGRPRALLRAPARIATGVAPVRTLTTATRETCRGPVRVIVTVNGLASGSGSGSATVIVIVAVLLAHSMITSSNAICMTAAGPDTGIGNGSGNENATVNGIESGDTVTTGRCPATGCGTGNANGKKNGIEIGNGNDSDSGSGSGSANESANGIVNVSETVIAIAIATATSRFLQPLSLETAVAVFAVNNAVADVLAVVAAAAAAVLLMMTTLATLMAAALRLLPLPLTPYRSVPVARPRGPVLPLLIPLLNALLLRSAALVTETATRLVMAAAVAVAGAAVVRATGGATASGGVVARRRATATLPMTPTTTRAPAASGWTSRSKSATDRMEWMLTAVVLVVPARTHTRLSARPATASGC